MVVPFGVRPFWRAELLPKVVSLPVAGLRVPLMSWPYWARPVLLYVVPVPVLSLIVLLLPVLLLIVPFVSPGGLVVLLGVCPFG